jgi:hypothetical protein
MDNPDTKLQKRERALSEKISAQSLKQGPNLLFDDDGGEKEPQEEERRREQKEGPIDESQEIAVDGKDIHTKIRGQATFSRNFPGGIFRILNKKVACPLFLLHDFPNPFDGFLELGFIHCQGCPKVTLAKSAKTCTRCNYDAGLIKQHAAKLP